MEAKQEIPEALKKQLSEMSKRHNEIIDKFSDVTAQINEQIEPFLIKVKEACETAKFKYGILESDFDEFLNQYKHYFLKNGFITPKHFEEFFIWLCGCRYPDEAFGTLEINESDFTLFHEYKELKLNPSGWTEHQERERLENRIEATGNETATTPKPAKQATDNDFTTLQWASIFYFVEPDLYGEIELKKDKLEKFKKDFSLNNSRDSLSNKHNEIVRVINGDKKNELTQHHIKTINAILPFLKNNYIEAFENAKDDLSLLQDNLDKKQ